MHTNHILLKLGVRLNTHTLKLCPGIFLEHGSIHKTLPRGFLEHGECIQSEGFHKHTQCEAVCQIEKVWLTGGSCETPKTATSLKSSARFI